MSQEWRPPIRNQAEKNLHANAQVLVIILFMIFVQSFFSISFFLYGPKVFILLTEPAQSCPGLKRMLNG
jgi:hypothetical protein